MVLCRLSTTYIATALECTKLCKPPPPTSTTPPSPTILPQQTRYHYVRTKDGPPFTRWIGRWSNSPGDPVLSSNFPSPPLPTISSYSLTASRSLINLVYCMASQVRHLHSVAKPLTTGVLQSYSDPLPTPALLTSLSHFLPSRNVASRYVKLAANKVRLAPNETYLGLF